MTIATEPISHNDEDDRIRSADARIMWANLILALWGAIVLVGGILLAFHERRSGGYSNAVEHPYVALGLGISFTAVAATTFGGAILGFMRARLAR